MIRINKENKKRALSGTNYKITPKDISSQDRGGIWADKFYKCEPNKWQKIQNYMAQEPKVNILTKIALQKKSIPAPNAYNKCWNWAAESSKNHDNLQKFLKGKRITFTDVIFAKKKLKEPGPSTYNAKDGYKIPHIPLSKNVPQCLMVEDAKFRSSQTPGSKYKPNFDIGRPKSASARISF